jgi:cytoskeletal protein RodZ
MASFGETLRRERELRGVSLREIADSTKISIRFLQALEQDRIEVLPGGVFRRAFVREYARYLGLDDDRLVAEFLYAHGEQEKDATGRQSREGTHPGTVLLVAVFAAGAVLSVFKASQREARTSATPAATAAPPQAPAPLAATPTPVPAVAEVAAHDSLVLTLSARQTCWIEARVDGQVVFNRELLEGQTETLEAQGEIVLSVGNAGGLSYTLNRLPGVSLGRSGEVRRNIVITKKSLPSFVEESTQIRASHSS